MLFTLLGMTMDLTMDFRLLQSQKAELPITFIPLLIIITFIPLLIVYVWSTQYSPLNNIAIIPFSISSSVTSVDKFSSEIE